MADQQSSVGRLGRGLLDEAEHIRAERAAAEAAAEQAALKTMVLELRGFAHARTFADREMKRQWGADRRFCKEQFVGSVIESEAGHPRIATLLYEDPHESKTVSMLIGVQRTNSSGDWQRVAVTGTADDPTIVPFEGPEEYADLAAAGQLLSYTGAVAFARKSAESTHEFIPATNINNLQSTAEALGL